MCLYFNKSKTDTLRKSKKTTITAYKVFCEANGVLYNYCMPGIPVFTKKGILKSNRPSKTLTKSEAETGKVDKGIHVFYISPHMDVTMGYRLLTVTCNISDLVAVGDNNEAVFMKVKVDPEVLKQFPENVNSRLQEPKKKTRKK